MKTRFLFALLVLLSSVYSQVALSSPFTVKPFSTGNNCSGYNFDFDIIDLQLPISHYEWDLGSSASNQFWNNQPALEVFFGSTGIITVKLILYSGSTSYIEYLEIHVRDLGCCNVIDGVATDASGKQFFNFLGSNNGVPIFPEEDTLPVPFKSTEL